MALKSLFYPEKEKTILRYYSWEVREPFLKVASERVFRKFTKGPFLTEDGMSVSQTPCNPFEEANVSNSEIYKLLSLLAHVSR
jgi:hypothetical protein